MLIGICDDIEMWRETIHDLCEQYFRANPFEHSYMLFSNGNDVVEYCKNEQNQKLDLMFLDVEMGEISGIDIKDFATKESKIWRIAFVSSYPEYIPDAFSTKTLGFISKPATLEQIARIINITNAELQENIILTFKDYNGEIIELHLDELLYFKSNDHYTEIYTTKTLINGRKNFLITRDLVEIENILRNYMFIRTHRSYIVNFDYIIDFSTDITLKNVQKHIPVGRFYRERAKKKYHECGERKVRIRKKI